ncbi:MAG: hypothetical protein PHD74_06510 [Candidatus Krumholzibacteria bacterium]|nr:hypothetical protein [Candidatus Krumholzibacteria bacterium]
MSPSMRSVSVRVLTAVVAVLFALQTLWFVSALAAEGKTFRLTFSMPENTLLHYKAFKQIGQSYGGSDVSMNQTAKVDVTCDGKQDSTGAYKVDLNYTEVKTSLVANGRLQEWEPPMKLEGSTIRVTISTAGDIVAYAAARPITGMSGPDDLRDLVDAWFVRLPDSAVAVGESWNEPIVEGEREGGEPDAKGEVVYTLKKIEKKGAIDVAYIEGKINLKLHTDTPAGVLIGDGKGDVKARVALVGGYIVEFKETMEIRGDVIAKDPITEKETKMKTAVTRNYERELQQ